jgi:small conductance mechanosensitive channel
MNVNDFDFQKYLDLAIPYGIKIVLALVIFVVGLSVIKILSGMLKRTMTARNVDPTIEKFVGSIAYYLMFAFVVIASLGQLGVQTASVIAILGAAGLAVGLALQGTLSNFAAGVMMILLRPIKVGDYIEVAGVGGSVAEVAIFATTLLTPDNKTIVIANSQVMGDTIVNYSTQPQRRIDLVIGIGYGASLEQVKKELQLIADADQRILHDKGVTIGVVELADSSVNLVFRTWVNTAYYWAVRFDLTERIKNRFDEVGIEIPFPQMAVHTRALTP